MRRRDDRHASRVLRLWPILTVLNLVLLLAVAVVAVAVALLQIRQDAAIRGGCVRLQIQRDDSNILAYNDYTAGLEAMRVNTRASSLLAASASSATDPRGKRVLSATADAFHDAAVNGGQRAARVRYAPPTDCNAAVDHPASYRPPPLVLFTSVAPCFDVKHRLRVTKCPRRRSST
jgi:hypothetical protein